MMHDRPNRAAALAQYARIANYYDATVLFRGVRAKGVAALRLRPGQTVVEAGCGTGINLAAMRRNVGPGGQVIGIDQSPQMLRRARVKIERCQWANVEVIESPLEEVDVAMTADALLFSFTHDIFRTPAAVESALAKVRPGGRVVAVCTRWDEHEGPALASAVIRLLSRRYMTTMDGMSEPWEMITTQLADVEHRRCWFGTMYVVSGTRVADGPS